MQFPVLMYAASAGPATDIHFFQELETLSLVLLVWVLQNFTKATP